MDDSPADKLGLHLHEQLFRNDGFVVVLDVVLRNDAIVLDALLRQEVRGVGLLKQGVAHVLLVAENLVDGAGVPFSLPAPVRIPSAISPAAILSMLEPSRYSR